MIIRFDKNDSSLDNANIVCNINTDNIKRILNDSIVPIVSRWINVYEPYLLNGTVHSRFTKIKNLSIHEALKIDRNNFVEEEITEGYNFDNVRIFLCDHWSYGYSFLTFFNDGKKYISIFVDPKYLQNDENLVKFIYAYIEYFIDEAIRDEVPFTRMNNNRAIVVAREFNIDDSILIIEYHKAIFKCIMQLLNREVIDSAVNLYNMVVPGFKYHGMLSEIPVDIDTIENIFKLASKEIENEDTDKLYYSIIKDIYRFI